MQVLLASACFCGSSSERRLQLVTVSIYCSRYVEHAVRDGGVPDFPTSRFIQTTSRCGLSASPKEIVPSLEQAAPVASIQWRFIALSLIHPLRAPPGHTKGNIAQYPYGDAHTSRNPARSAARRIDMALFGTAQSMRGAPATISV